MHRPRHRASHWPYCHSMLLLSSQSARVIPPELSLSSGRRSGTHHLLWTLAACGNTILTSDKLVFCFFCCLKFWTGQVDFELLPHIQCAYFTRPQQPRAHRCHTATAASGCLGKTAQQSEAQRLVRSCATVLWLHTQQSARNRAACEQICVSVLPSPL